MGYAETVMRLRDNDSDIDKARQAETDDEDAGL